MARLVAVFVTLCTAFATCPELPPTAFVLPDVLSTVNANWQQFEHGVQFIDINGDSLPDLIQGFQSDMNPSSTSSCVYINTQCGWVLQANYTGPVSSCLPSSVMVIKNVDVPFRGMTVGSFRSAVASEFLADVASVQVIASKTGRVQASFMQMEDVATSEQGFDVVINGQRNHFQRGY